MWLSQESGRRGGGNLQSRRTGGGVQGEGHPEEAGHRERREKHKAGAIEWCGGFEEK